MVSRILSVGKTLYSVHAKVQRLPKPGCRCSAESCAFCPGGNAALTAIALSKLGLDSVLCSKIGSDMNGGLIRQSLSDLGVDTRFLVSDGKIKTGAILIHDDENGEESVTVFDGAGEFLSLDDIEDAFTCYPDAVYLRSDIRPVLAEDVLGFASEQNVPIFFDGRGCSKFEFCKEEMPTLEAFILSSEEIPYYCGILPSDMQRCFDAVIQLSVNIRAKYYIIELGARGSIVYDGKYMEIVTSCRNPLDIADRATLSSAYAAALIAEYMSSQDMLNAVRYAESALALGAAKAKQIDSLPTLQELKVFAANQESKT